MYVTVRLLNRFDKDLWYHVPTQHQAIIKPGTLIMVPLQKRQEYALVTDCFSKLPHKPTFIIKDIHGPIDFPPDAHYQQFIEKIARYYLIPPLHFYARITTFLHDKKKEDVPAPSSHMFTTPKKIHLTDEQQAIVDYLIPHLDHPTYTPTLIHGVTGSGKTEVYKKIIEQCIRNNKTVIMLLPEVSLSLQFERLFKTHLSHVVSFGFHSATTPAERRALWAALKAQQPLLILGVHLPIMLPISNLGAIIIDEEHEQGFIEKKHPKINSKEVAIWRAHTYQIPIILGSATPSITSLHNVQHKQWKLFRITKRFAGAFPTVRKVILDTKSAKRRKHFWISQELELAVSHCLEHKEQAIIYLNRRGYSFFVQCKACGFIFECPHCAVSLTLHAVQGNVLRCHYCDYKKNLPTCCPTCSAPESQFLKKGLGTQQAVNIFKELFPTARIERADLDTTSKKRTWKLTVEQFEQGEIDILIGTQTITKGYHFPGVTLVGVLWADLNLHFPVFNAAETTLQQLIQVAGRAGRCSAQSTVIIQALQDHSIFSYVNEASYLDFCAKELEQRAQIIYPPACHLAHVELRHASAQTVELDAQTCIDTLMALCAHNNLNVTLLGPAEPLISRIQNVEIRHIFFKAQSFKDLHTLLKNINQTNYQSSLFVVFS